MPGPDVTCGKYANAALEFNKNSIGVPVVAPDFKAIQMEKERKRIEWEKEHGPNPSGRGGFGRRGRGGLGFKGGDRRERGNFGKPHDNDKYDDRRRERGGFDRGRR